MYKAVKNAKILFACEVAGAVISALSIAMISFVDSDWFQYFIAVVFWSGLLTMLFLSSIIRLLLKQRRNFLRLKGISVKQRVPGIICFSWNRKNAVIYSVTIVGITLLVLDAFFGFLPQTAVFPVISLTLLSFMLHCIFDGLYYKVYKQIKESMDNDAKY